MIRQKQMPRFCFWFPSVIARTTFSHNRVFAVHVLKLCAKILHVLNMFCIVSLFGMHTLDYAL